MCSHVIRLLVSGLLLAPLLGIAESTGSTETSSERQLLIRLHEADLMEIAAGRLAIARGTTAAIRQYGTDLVKDHGLVEEQVGGLAARMSVILPPPAEEPGLTHLANLTGAAFDRAFVTMMVEDHDKVIALVQGAHSRVRDPQLAALLLKLLPMLENHRDTALALSQTTRS